MNRIIAAALILAASAVPAWAAVAVQVPEPATMSLFGLGVGGAYLVKRFIGRK
jgi:PEP-CTERM motif